MPNLPRHVPGAGGPVGSAPAALPLPKYSQGEADAAVGLGHAVVERRDSKAAIGAAAMRAAKMHAPQAASLARSHAPPAPINTGDVWAVRCAFGRHFTGLGVCCRAAGGVLICLLCACRNSNCGVAPIHGVMTRCVFLLGL